MINFIVCDDNKVILDKVGSIVDNVMMKNHLAYKKHLFNDYNKSFDKLSSSKILNKIYILDIETSTSSGIDVARKIREKDMESVIIFLTSHDELGYTILKNEFLFLNFICKFDDYENKLVTSIKKGLSILGQKTVIKFEDKGTLYTIPSNDVLYITRDSVDRKCVIKTDYTEFKINKTLVEMYDMVDGRFKQTHRACIVNMDRVVMTNYTKKQILFDNGLCINLISSNFKKEVVSK